MKTKSLIAVALTAGLVCGTAWITYAVVCSTRNTQPDIWTDDLEEHLVERDPHKRWDVLQNESSYLLDRHLLDEFPNNLAVQANCYISRSYIQSHTMLFIGLAAKLRMRANGEWRLHCYALNTYRNTDAVVLFWRNEQLKQVTYAFPGNCRAGSFVFSAAVPVKLPQGPVPPSTTAVYPEVVEVPTDVPLAIAFRNRNGQMTSCIQVDVESSGGGHPNGSD